MNDQDAEISRLRAENNRLRAALKEAIYEVSHDSARAWEGKYHPYIDAAKVDWWRVALTRASDSAEGGLK